MGGAFAVAAAALTRVDPVVNLSGPIEYASSKYSWRSALIGLSGDALVVTDDLGDDEGQELLGEFRVELGIGRQGAQALNLLLFARRVSRGKPAGSFQFAHGAGDFEPFSQQVHQRRIKVVDASAQAHQPGLNLLGGGGAGVAVLGAHQCTTTSMRWKLFTSV